MRNIFFVLVVATLFSFLGCDDASETPAQKRVVKEKVNPKTAPESAPSTAQSPGRVSGQLKVNVKPEPAIADGCLTASSSGSGQINYSWEINGLEISDQTSNTLCEGFWRDDEVTVTASTGNLSGTYSVIVANSPPRITEVAINPDGIPKHIDLVVSPVVFDADNDSVDISYQWYINDEADTLLTENILPAKSYLRGDTIRFTIAITDGYVDGKIYESASLVVPNAAPQILSQPPGEFESLEYSYQIEAIDPDGDKLTYQLEDAPEGMTIDEATGLINWPLADVAAGEYQIKIIVTDPDGSTGGQKYTLSLEKRRAVPQE